MPRYSTGAIVLHWLTAAALIFQIAFAGHLEGVLGPDKFAAFQLHKSVGITILALTLVRLAWRLSHRAPAYPATLAGWERKLATATHWLFYGLLLAIPLSGWAAVSASPLQIPTRLFWVAPFPDLPVAQSAFKPVAALHHLLVFGLYGLLALHVAGALKHQLLPRDEAVLGRMAPGARHGWKEPRLWLIAALAVAIFVTGTLVQPPAPAASATGPAPEAGAMTPPALAGANWIVERGSTLGFTTAWSGQKVEGRFDRWAAAIVFDPATLDQARIRVAIDLTSVVTGDGQRDASLKAPDWFDTARQSTARFEADRIERTSIGYVAHGTLSLKGMSRPLDLPFTLSEGSPALATAEISLDRTDFNLGVAQPVSQIPAAVTVWLSLKARREP